MWKKINVRRIIYPLSLGLKDILHPNKVTKILLCVHLFIHISYAFLLWHEKNERRFDKLKLAKKKKLDSTRHNIVIPDQYASWNQTEYKSILCNKRSVSNLELSSLLGTEDITLSHSPLGCSLINTVTMA